jgi:hypothetical protein
MMRKQETRIRNNIEAWIFLFIFVSRHPESRPKSGRRIFGVLFIIIFYRKNIVRCNPKQILRPAGRRLQDDGYLIGRRPQSLP